MMTYGSLITKGAEHSATFGDLFQKVNGQISVATGS